MIGTSMGALSVLMASVISVSAQAKVSQQELHESDLMWDSEPSLSLEISELLSEQQDA